MTITASEARVLATLSMTPITAADIKRSLPGATPVATIRTVLVRLADKGLAATVAATRDAWVITADGAQAKAAQR